MGQESQHSILLLSMFRRQQSTKVQAQITESSSQNICREGRLQLWTADAHRGCSGHGFSPQTGEQQTLIQSLTGFHSDLWPQNVWSFPPLKACWGQWGCCQTAVPPHGVTGATGVQSLSGTQREACWDADSCCTGAIETPENVIMGREVAAYIQDPVGVVRRL